MKDSYRFVQERINQIEALRRIQKTVDPASGMSLHIRRGVIHDGDHEEEDHRPWVSVELSENMDPILDLVISSMISSLKFWVSTSEHDAKECAEAAKKGREFLKRNQ